MTTLEEDFKEYPNLQVVDREIVGITQLNFGQHAEEFATCTTYRVNPETGEIIFSFEPAEPDPEESDT